MRLFTPVPWFLLSWLLLIMFVVRWFHVLCVGANREEEARSANNRRDEPDGLHAVS